MRNRAKCKLCEEVIESFHRTDEVSCKCGEITICGGDWKYYAASNDWSNFIRVDDFGAEVPVKVLDKTSAEEHKSESPVQEANDPLSALNDMILRIEQLPDIAMTQPVTQYDLYSFLVLFREILRS